MDLSHYFTISGKAGIFQLVGQTKNGIIVESMIDKKRIPAYSNQKIVSLEDISIFLIDEDIPLKEVFKAIYAKEEGEKVDIKVLKGKNELFGYFEEVMPNFDEERVYPSDVKKVLQWYNQLIDFDLISLDEEEVEEKSEEKVSE